MQPTTFQSLTLEFWIKFLEFPSLTQNTILSQDTNLIIQVSSNDRRTLTITFMSNAQDLVFTNADIYESPVAVWRHLSAQYIQADKAIIGTN